MPSLYDPATNDRLTADQRTVLGRLHALSDNQRLSLLETIFLATLLDPDAPVGDVLTTSAAVLIIEEVK